MKAEHRHELKTNELADFITHFPDWARKNRNTLIYLGVLAVIVIGYTIWYNYQTRIVTAADKRNLTALISRFPRFKDSVIRSQMAPAEQRQDLSFQFITNLADDLGSLANSTKDDAVAAIAFAMQAEAYRTYLQYKLDPPTEQDRQKQLNQAIEACNNALAKSKKYPSITAFAKFELGMCYEGLADFEQARKAYEDLTADTSLEGTTSYAAAQRRLQDMGYFTEELTFPPSPVQQQPAAPQFIEPQEAQPQLFFQQPNTPAAPLIPDLNSE